MNELIRAFAEKIELSMDEYIKAVEKAGKSISEPRSNDISSIRAIIYTPASSLEESIHEVKDYLKTMKTGWWFLGSRLKTNIAKVVTEFENPLAASLAAENLKLQRKLDDALAQINELKVLTNALKLQLESRSIESRPIPVPTSAVKSTNHNHDESQDDLWNLQEGSTSTPASRKSFPNFKNLSQTPESHGSLEMGMFAQRK